MKTETKFKQFNTILFTEYDKNLQGTNFAVFCNLLALAYNTDSDYKHHFNGKKINIKAGQLLTTLSQIEESTGVTRKTVAICLDRLSKCGYIMVKHTLPKYQPSSTNCRSLITISEDALVKYDHNYKQTKIEKPEPIIEEPIIESTEPKALTIAKTAVNNTVYSEDPRNLVELASFVNDNYDATPDAEKSLELYNYLLALVQAKPENTQTSLYNMENIVERYKGKSLRKEIANHLVNICINRRTKSGIELKNFSFNSVWLSKFKQKLEDSDLLNDKLNTNASNSSNLNELI